MTLSDIGRIARVVRASKGSLEPCLNEGWTDAGEIAFFVANWLSPQADPDHPLKRTITLPSADGSDPDGE